MERENKPSCYWIDLSHFEYSSFSYCVLTLHHIPRSSKNDTKHNKHITLGGQ